MKHKNTLEGDSREMPAIPIIKTKAIEFITKFTNEYKNGNMVKIPTAWLFEIGVKDSLEIPGVEGIRFYSAINADEFTGLNGNLTFILVPVGANQVDLEDEVLYEFSQLCPDVCSLDENGNRINGSLISVARPFDIPKSFYFPRSFFDNLPNQDTLGIRLYSIIKHSKLTLQIIPVEDVAPYYNDILPAINQQKDYHVCDINSTTHCDTNSSLYLL